MHHALYVEEILLNVLEHCCTPPSVRQPQGRRYTADLAALARTCRTFKEHALDLLWLELEDLSPLVRCLHEAYRVNDRVLVFVADDTTSAYPLRQCYSISRPLSEAEWNILRGYARRVRFLVNIEGHLGYLDNDTIEAVFNPPFLEPLFPNLRSIHWVDSEDGLNFPMRHLAVPSLTSVTLITDFYEHRSRNFLIAAADLCPNIRQFRIYPSISHLLDAPICRHVHRWANLETVDCPTIIFDMDAIMHLSSISTLKWLSFMLSAKLADHISGLGSVLVFPNIAHLAILSESLSFVTGLLSRIRLPTIQGLVIKVWTHLSIRAIEAYSSIIRNACPSDTLIHFNLMHVENQMNLERQAFSSLRLTLNTILPFTTFDSLRGIHINLECSVSLTDADLLNLVSASPRMEHLIINDKWGWRTEGGITLTGLVELLRTCPSLYDICLALDTRTFTRVPRRLDVRFPARSWLRMNVVDSHIWAADVSAVASVFTELKLDPAVFAAWHGSDIRDLVGAGVSSFLWGHVYREVKELFMEQSITLGT